MVWKVCCLLRRKRKLFSSFACGPFPAEEKIACLLTCIIYDYITQIILICLSRTVFILHKNSKHINIIFLSNKGFTISSDTVMELILKLYAKVCIHVIQVGGTLRFIKHLKKFVRVLNQNGRAQC